MNFKLLHTYQTILFDRFTYQQNSRKLIILLTWAGWFREKAKVIMLSRKTKVDACFIMLLLEVPIVSNWSEHSNSTAIFIWNWKHTKLDQNNVIIQVICNLQIQVWNINRYASYLVCINYCVLMFKSVWNVINAIIAWSFL